VKPNGVHPLSLGFNDRLTGVELADGQVIERTAVFIRPGNTPYDDGLLAGLGCEPDGAGFPVADAADRTSVSGVWAAGNVADPRAQVVTSAGAGSAAAIAINADLVQQDAERALVRVRPCDPLALTPMTSRSLGSDPCAAGTSSSSPTTVRALICSLSMRAARMSLNSASTQSVIPNEAK
jgi:hypothetical protein